MAVPTGTTNEPTTPASGRRRPRRPKFGWIVVVSIAFRFGREIIDRVAFARFGIIGGLVVTVALVAAMLGWRYLQKRKVRAHGGEELTPEGVVQQLVDSGLGGPAFAEDGTIFGASLLAVNQRTKLLEVNTEYDVFGSAGQRLATVSQVGQSRGKQLARILTAFDQYFTHHFDVIDPDGVMVLRLTRPRKVFKTKVHVFDGSDRFLGTIRQENVFWKIRFELTDPWGSVVGRMKADKLQAWDFQIIDLDGRPVSTIVKSWEGWARTAFTRADRYAVRIHEPVGGFLRPLTVAAALAIDLGLKQDARGFG